MRKIYLFLALFITFNISNVKAITFYNKILNDNGGKETILNKTVPDFSKVSPKTTSNYTDYGPVPSLRKKYYYYPNTCSDSYSFNEQTGEYTLINPSKINYSESNAIGKYCLTDEGNIIKIINYKKYLSYYYVVSYQNFDKTDKSVYSTIDDNGISYYYRGAIDNNWVKFGVSDDDYYLIDNDIEYYDDQEIAKECESNTDYTCDKIISKGDDMYWRVLRINGDGSIRLIYAGNISPKENESVNSLERSNSIFNTYGYLENFEESEANMVDLYKSKRVYYLLNKWYSYMFGDNNEYLTLANFCYGDEKSSTKPQDNNFSTSPDFDYYYASYDRLTTYKPSLKCNSGLSESNVGLISMDEAMFAGLNDKDNFGNYLNNFDNVLTMSPEYYYNYTRTFFYHTIVANHASLPYNSYRNTMSPNRVSYRPVINLKSGIFVTGSGTWNDPYIPTLEDTKEETSVVIEENPKTGNTIINLVILMILTPIIIIILKKNNKKV